MKNLFLTAFAIFTIFSATAQTHFSDSVTHVAGMDKRGANQAILEATFDVTVTDDSTTTRNELKYRAITSVLNAIIFKGVPGFNDGTPLQPDTTMLNEKRDYFTGFYGDVDKMTYRSLLDKARCVSFTNFYSIRYSAIDYDRNADGSKTIKMRLTVMYHRLYNELKSNGIITEDKNIE